MANLIMGGTYPQLAPTVPPPAGPTPPTSAAAPTHPGETSSWQDWLKVALETGVAVYAAKNQPKNPTPSSSVQPQTTFWGQYTRPQQDSATVGGPGFNFSPTILVIGAALFLVVILILRK